MVRGPIFETLPGGLDIAHWFNHKVRAGQFHNVGGDGTWLSSEPHGWLWHLVTVDHDDQVFWLLSIGTGDTSDLLFVTSGLRCHLACEWRNKPSAEQDWGYDALVWMAGLIEAYEDGWADDSGRLQRA